MRPTKAAKPKASNKAYPIREASNVEVLSLCCSRSLAHRTTTSASLAGDGNPLCFVSPGFSSLTGYSEPECLGRNCRFLQAGKGEPSAIEALRAGLSERRFSATEVTNYRKDGQAFQNLLSLVPVLGGDGTTLLHFVGVQCDLDERRRRGEAVDDAFSAKWQEHVRQFLGAFALVDTASSATQSATSICAVSPGFCSLTGYSQADILGWDFLSLCGPDSSERDMRRLTSSQCSRAPAVVRLLCYKRDGTPFWALVLSCPLASIGSAVAERVGAPAAGHPTTSSDRMAMGAAGPGGAVRQGPGHASAATKSPGSAAMVGVSPGGTGVARTLGGASPSAAGLAAGSTAEATTSGRYSLYCLVDVTQARLKRVGGKYVLGKAIGAGAFGLVRIGRNMLTDELVAVKGVDATRFRSIAEIEQIQEEMSVLSSLKHPNIIRLHDVHFQSNTFFLVMEYAGNGSLVHFLQQYGSSRPFGDSTRHCLDETTAARVFVQMVSALDYCHRRHVVHRDLKPENILMDHENNLKIADFGLAAVAAPFSGGLTLQCGTPEFTAPEITEGREYDGPSVDIWSMGVLLYEVLSGSLPFRGANQAALFKSIQRGVYDPLPSAISHDCQDLVRRMLIVDPECRATMDDILASTWVAKATAGVAGVSSSLGFGPLSAGLAGNDEPSANCSCGGAPGLRRNFGNGGAVTKRGNDCTGACGASGPGPGTAGDDCFPSRAPIHDSVKLVIPSMASDRGAPQQRFRISYQLYHHLGDHLRRGGHLQRPQLLQQGLQLRQVVRPHKVHYRA
ncbi:putative serine/threonine-protein kinase [Tetrabaena socialis]|uniref:Putative serine/threonine-protein kinase n=1 Tax=Tetrabaena socialis TaxID=47790 RepID=A0A2J8A149_9CHLO|nr:putative serine/threonine-protein kinase [Tetrabaena socialis]|eukprot:PNH06249.1 putative serine/threonine-protein kinase [Tetrabaena socialis]